MTNSNQKKKNQLGESYGTANSKLRKLIMFALVKELGKNICFQCGEKIEEIKDFSIEHKQPYLDSENPQELFYDLNNIAYSHIICNIRASRRNYVRKDHPSYQTYKRGCRCEECKSLEKLRRRDQRIRGIKT